MCDVAERDVVPLLARQAAVLFDERSWLDDTDRERRRRSTSSEADCRELREWPRARLRRWLRRQAL